MAKRVGKGSPSRGPGSLLRHLWADERGQDLVEYVLLLGLITLVVIAALNAVADTVNDTFSETASTVSAP